MFQEVGQLKPKKMTGALGSLDMYEEILKIHKRNHFGVQRTIEMIKEKFKWRKHYRKLVKEVLKNCERCTRICPAKMDFSKGSLTTHETWF